MDESDRNEDWDHPLKVGELARRTGLSIRTLHYWEEIGLLVPDRQPSSGHRLYGVPELARLQQVLTLRQLGFSLQEVADCLARPEFSPLATIELHLAKLRQRMELERRLLERLEGLAGRLRRAEDVSARTLIETLEDMTMLEKYYTPEQLEQLAARREELGEEGMRQGENDWQVLLSEVRAAMDRGADPVSPEVQALSRRWTALVAQFTGGDPGIARSLKKMYDEEPEAGARFGLDPEIRQFMARASKP